MIDGLIIVALTVSGLRRLVFNAVPIELKLAITAGIGLFHPLLRSNRCGLHLHQARITSGGTGSRRS